MKRVALAAGALCALASPVFATEVHPAGRPGAKVRPVSAAFDLADHPQVRRGEALAQEEALAPAPAVPRNMIIDEQAPSVEFRTAEGGPVLGAGALGRNGRDVPRLAHVRLGWEF